ncbi:transposase [Rarobacter incanus]
MLEAPELWNENGLIPQRKNKGRCYFAEEKAAAVWVVRTLRAELGTSQGTTTRVAEQLGYGVESVRSWVRQADIDDGVKPGVTTDEQARMRELEQEVRELKRANETLKRAASFFGAQLDRHHRN